MRSLRSKRYHGPVRRGKSFQQYPLVAFSPLLPGQQGKIPAGDPGLWAQALCHYPSLLRCWMKRWQKRAPRFPYAGVYWIMENLWPLEARKQARVWVPQNPYGLAAKWLELLRDERHMALMNAWMRHTGRARSSLHGAAEVLDELVHGAKIKGWEFANMRLPGTLIYDTEVLHWHAHMQGLTANDCRCLLRRKHLTTPELLRGLRKFLKDRWVRFGLVSSYMSPYAVLLPAPDYATSLARTEFVLERPYEASEGELDHIQRTTHYGRAWMRFVSDLEMDDHVRRTFSESGIFYPDDHGAIRRGHLRQWAWFARGRFSRSRIRGQ